MLPIYDIGTGGPLKCSQHEGSCQCPVAFFQDPRIRVFSDFKPIRRWGVVSMTPSGYLYTVPEHYQVAVHKWGHTIANQLASLDPYLLGRWGEPLPPAELDVYGVILAGGFDAV